MKTKKQNLENRPPIYDHTSCQCDKDCKNCKTADVIEKLVLEEQNLTKKLDLIFNA